MEDLNENLSLDESNDTIEKNLSEEENSPELVQEFTENQDEIQDEMT